MPKLVASLLVGGAFAWLLERGGLPLVPKAGAFATMAWWAIPVAILTNAIASYFRTCRWIFLLRPIAPKLSAARVLGIGFVGFTAITMAPLRTGEFVRPYLLSRDGDVTFTQGLGATVAERIIDGFVVTVSLFFALLFATPLSPLPNHLGDLRLDVALVPKAAYSGLSVFAAALLTLVAFHWRREFFVRVLDALLGTVSKRLAAFVTTRVERVAAGLRFFPSSRDLVPFALATAAYYASLALGCWATLHGCGIPATLAETCVLIGVLSLAILVPAGPGFFGAYQLSTYYGLAMFFPENVVLSAGAAFVFITYVAQIGVTLLSCVVGFALMGLNPPEGARPVVPGLERAVSAKAAKVPFPWGPLATALVTLSAASLSVALGCAQLGLGKARLAFLLHNNVHPGIRANLLVLSALSLLVPVVLALPPLVLHGRAAAVGLARLAALISPLVVFCAIPWLSNYEVAAQGPLGYLVLLTGTALVLERLLRLSLSSPLPGFGARPGRRALLSGRAKRTALNVLVVLMASAYAAYSAYFSILQHHRFQTGGHDLGVYTSALANLEAGHFFRSTILNPAVSLLAHHAEFGALYIVPVYALFPRAETLLTLQSIAIGGAAVPLYLFAATQLPRSSAAVIALAYLFFAPLHGPTFDDFHFMPMTLPVWFTLFYGLAKRRPSIVVASVLVLLPMHEETGLMLAVLGFYMLACGYWPKVGLAFGAIGMAWFTLMRGVVIPFYGDADGDGMLATLVAPGEHGFGSAVKTLLANPNYVWKTLATTTKLQYVLHLIGPLLLLPLRQPLLLGLLVPGFLFTLFAADHDPLASIALRYTTDWIPWLFLAVVVALRGLATEEQPILRRRAAVSILFLTVLCHSNSFGAILQHGTFMGGLHRVSFGITRGEQRRYADFRRLLAELPLTARVAATDPQSPHLGRWVEACTLRVSHCNADYLLISGHDFSAEERAQVKAALALSSYGLVDSIDEFYLFERDRVSEGTANALRSLGLA